MRSRLLDAVTATGAGSSIFLAEPKSKHKVDISFVDADTSITVLVVELQSSSDGRAVADADAVWTTEVTMTFSAAQLTAKKGVFNIVDKLMKRIRLNVKTATGIGAGDSITGIHTEGLN